MKNLTVSCYAIAFCMLGLAMAMLMQPQQLNLNSISDFSEQDFGAIAHY